MYITHTCVHTLILHPLHIWILLPFHGVILEVQLHLWANLLFQQSAGDQTLSTISTHKSLISMNVLKVSSRNVPMLTSACCLLLSKSEPESSGPSSLRECKNKRKEKRKKSSCWTKFKPTDILRNSANVPSHDMRKNTSTELVRSEQTRQEISKVLRV